MTDSKEQLTELLSLIQNKTWENYKFYKDSERNDELTFSVSRELEEFTDVESSMIQNLCHVFDTEDYEITVDAKEEALYVKFFNICVEAEGVFN